MKPATEADRVDLYSSASGLQVSSVPSSVDSFFHPANDNHRSKSYNPLSATPAAPTTTDYNSADRLYDIVAREVNDKIQPPFSDITKGLADGLSKKILDLSSENMYGTREEMMDGFRQSYLMDSLERNYGNITQVARESKGDKSLDSQRKFVNRAIDEYGLRGDYLDGLRPQKDSPKIESSYNLSLEPKIVQSALEESFAPYSNKLSPELYSSVKENIIATSYDLARTLENYIVTKESTIQDLVEQTRGMSLEQAEDKVERDVIMTAMVNADFNKEKACQYLGDSRRALDRRIKELDLKEELAKAKKGETKDSEQPTSEDQRSKKADSDTDRIKQLQEELESKLDQDIQHVA